MKIFSAPQIHAWDAATIAEQQITGSMLMERACVAFTRTFLQVIQPDAPILIVCGTGNNGGDGLGIARLLHHAGYAATVCIIGAIENGSVDARLNDQRLRALPVDVRQLSEGDALPDLPYPVIIDALFGSGLNRPVTGWHAAIIEQMNAADAFRVAVDIPSGLFADTISTGAIVRADWTITFETPKLSFFFADNAAYTGDWEVVKIGLSEAWAAQASSGDHLLTDEQFSAVFTARARFSHKGTYGSALVVAGSTRTPGAAALSSFAALKTGAGLVTLCSDGYIPEHPEVMHAPTDEMVAVLQNKTFSCIAAGPGMGTDAKAVHTLTQLLLHAHQPLVLDADAITILSAHPELQDILPENSILTPHPKEYSRLFGVAEHWKALYDDIRAQAMRMRVIIVYKQAYTMIALPNGDIYFNSTGNPGMATAGSGDVLTGMITGLIAQGFASADAALAAVYLHGLAGDMAMEAMGGQNLVAGDLIEYIQLAMGVVRGEL